MKKNPKRILLAVDLAANDLALTARIWEALEPLLPSRGAIVEPVTILDREAIVIGNILKSRIGKLRTVTEKHLGERLATLGLKKLAPPRVLFADGSSTGQAVKALLNHAKQTDCDLIALSSHSHKGMKRLFLGSFAETLSLKSTIPILVVNPVQRKTSSKSNVILFPTDFSPQSRAGLQLVCDSFKENKAKIVLYHSYIFPNQIYLQPFAAYPTPQAFVEEDFKKRSRLGKDWCDQIRASGMNCELVMDRKSYFIADGILGEIQRQKAKMVAMVSNTGRLGALLGSTTREILRNSPRPVWVVHPDKKSRPKKVSNKKRGPSRTAAST